MNKLIVTFLLTVYSTIVFAQPAGFKEVKNVAAFQQELTKANISIQDIVSDFIQIKNMSLLAEKIKSKGKFYFKKEDKVRIEYTQPFTYLLVMNNGQVMVKDEQKTSKINTKNSKAMQSVNRIMIDCMRGTVLQNADFKVTVFDNSTQYLLSMVPVTDAMKKMFQQINVYLLKKNFNVDKLSMVELGGDFTDMNFVNAQHNTGLNESLFKVK
jgi:outer membrane lipoprotein-sorting protein